MKDNHQLRLLLFYSSWKRCETDSLSFSFMLFIHFHNCNDGFRYVEHLCTSNRYLIYTHRLIHVEKHMNHMYQFIHRNSITKNEKIQRPTIICHRTCLTAWRCDKSIKNGKRIRKRTKENHKKEEEKEAEY